MFSGGIEMEHCTKMALSLPSYYQLYYWGETFEVRFLF